MPEIPATQEIPAIWLQGAGCSGCSISVLNAVSPPITQLILDEVVPGKHVSLRFHPSVMGLHLPAASRAIPITICSGYFAPIASA